MGIRIEFRANAGKYYGGTREGEEATLRQHIGRALSSFFDEFNELEADITVDAFYVCNTARVKVLFTLDDEKFRCFMPLGGSQIGEVYAIKGQTTITQQSLSDYFAIGCLETDFDSKSIP